MSLTAAISIGRSALNASSIGVQVAGNNMANAATPGYTRQIARMAPIRGGGGGPQISIGAGVQIRDIQRQIDVAVEDRLRGAISDEAASRALSGLATQVEATLGELGDNDLSSELTNFFRSWSERANQTRSSASVIQQGDKLAQFMRRVRADLGNQRSQADDALGRAMVQANQLINTIASLNRSISDAETGNDPANTLRDERDAAIARLAEFVDVTVVDRGREGADVLVGSIPVVLGAVPRGLELRRESVNGDVQLSVRTRADGSELNITSGQIGAWLAARETVVHTTIDRLDTLASQLIFQMNQLHSTGTNASGMTSSVGSLAIPVQDRARAINDPLNETFAQLPFAARNGGFVVNVRERSSGALQSVRINVDLDGVTNAGTAGTGDDTTPDALVAQLNAIPGLSASYSADGRISVNSAAGFDFSFSDDSSGVLATVGLNSFFTGVDARSIGVREDLKSDSGLLAAGRLVNGSLVENGTALALAGLQNTPLQALGGLSLTDHWRDSVQIVGGAAAASRTATEANVIIKQSLEAQRAAVSGVSIDEESINLLDFQRQFQAAARVISVSDEMARQLINLI